MAAQTFSFRSYVAHPTHGPLPGILLLLTISTGVVDATSILGLGRVFVANMTGNIVFIGFALAGAPGFSLLGSITALAAFLVGAAVGGMMIGRTSHRARLLRNGLVFQVVCATLATCVAAVGGGGTAAQVAILATIALALGVQNAVVRSLAVPDLTTTVLTLTLTGIAADLRSGEIATALRRLTAVLAMLVGALAGAVLVLQEGVVAGLIAVVALFVVALVGAALASRSTRPWTARRR
ncbi:uncharacterized membrane protein YoaK (UPF0700 family) [Friedmanniella endophytica]|uniref:Uncharacterized membrane protein YoaK (UPF0700 family) n=1 Tax=Microlunatus kandeliicorticis TaxID=1759536 RepID=A0A7W3IS14_9ACTN|nr:YoaK family protein [Microlunatus kandeliicorticis]MBA8794110.1 uncharacterized membrane protein YoaK (UPF0700 family) [Microlunatus kandeliicorticis]